MQNLTKKKFDRYWDMIDVDKKDGNKNGKNGETRTGQVVGQLGGCYVFVRSCNLKCLTANDGGC